MAGEAASFLPLPHSHTPASSPWEIDGSSCLLERNFSWSGEQIGLTVLVLGGAEAVVRILPFRLAAAAGGLDSPPSGLLYE